MADDYTPEWKPNRDNSRIETMMGGQVLSVFPDLKSGEAANGPFYSAFDLEGETIEQMQADAVRQCYASLKQSVSDFEAGAAKLGISLD